MLEWLGVSEGAGSGVKQVSVPGVRPVVLCLSQCEFPFIEVKFITFDRLSKSFKSDITFGWEMGVACRQRAKTGVPSARPSVFRSYDPKTCPNGSSPD